MNRFRVLLAALLTLSLLLAAVPVTAGPAPKTDVSTQQGRVQAFQEIVALVKAPTVDWPALRAAYRSKLQETVRARDKEFNEQLDVTLEAAINAGEAGELSAGVVAQMVDKLLQKVFSLNVKHEFIAAKEKVAAGDNAAALHHIDEAIAYFEALRGTVQKRDKAFGTTLEAEIDAALTAAQQAAEQGDAKMLYFLQPAVTHNLVITFYLAITHYANVIEQGAAAGKDVSASMSEGWSFFQSILGNVGKKTPDLRDFVNTRLNPVQGDPRLVKADEIIAAMSAGLFGYVQNYTTQYEQQWDSLNRYHATAEGAIIAKGMVKKLGELLGAEAGARYAEAVNGWAKASLDGDRVTASVHAQVVADLSRQAQLKAAAAPADAILLTIGSATVKANGKWQAVDAAAKIENNRTLIPVRFVSEALGANVIWSDVARTVTIEQGGTVIVLTIGSTALTVNGAPSTLDVPAQIENGRTFVPVRFVSEVLGAKVEWNAINRTVYIQK